MNAALARSVAGALCRVCARCWASWRRASDSASSVGGTAGREGQRSTVALMGDYAFSKRTSLNFGVFRNSLSGALAADPTSLAVLGLIDPATRSVSGKASTGVAVGLNHRF